MAKKIKFPLSMRDGYQARNIDELREYFDISKALEYLLDGSLKTWLEDRYYMTEAEKVAKINPYGKNVKEDLCELLGVEMEVEAEQVDVEEIERKKERLNRLKQYTDDEFIWSKIDNVAFDQEELADLLDEGVREIYLCGSRFQVPYAIKNVKYIGVVEVCVYINTSEIVYEKEIEGMFENINVLNEIIIIDPVIDKALNYLWGRNSVGYDFEKGVEILIKAVLTGNKEAYACMLFEVNDNYDFFFENIMLHDRKLGEEIDNYYAVYHEGFCTDDGIYLKLDGYMTDKKDFVERLQKSDYVRCYEKYVELCTDVWIYSRREKIEICQNESMVIEVLKKGIEKKSAFCAWVYSELEYDRNLKLTYLHKAMEYCDNGVPRGMRLVNRITESLLEISENFEIITRFVDNEAKKYNKYSVLEVFESYRRLAFLYAHYNYKFYAKYRNIIPYNIERAKKYAKKAVELGIYILTKKQTISDELHKGYIDDYQDEEDLNMQELKDIANNSR